MIDPGKPKKISKFTKLKIKSLGQIKLMPFISVIRRVLKRRPIASTSRNEFVERRGRDLRSAATGRRGCTMMRSGMH